MKEFKQMHVYCRIRPISPPECFKWLDFEPPTTVVVTPPQHVLQPHKHIGLRETRFTFRKVFDVETTQHDICREVGQPLVQNLLKGCDSLLFTYGITGSGKTYTMTGGDTANRGLMPRCLELLFADISVWQAPKGLFKPDGLNGYALNHTQQHNISSAIQQMCAVFVTYVEFYNNCVYDLLEVGPMQKTLQSRIIREDMQRCQMYVHGVSELQVTNVDEALRVFQMGQKRKRMGHTILNAESSRSHCAFTIRFVQTHLQVNGTSGGGIMVSQLTLVDLAGSERSTRTKSSGLRLREAANINNSLLTLRTCMEYLRENQQAPTGVPPKKIPYRDSKLTHMFKNYFEGSGQVAMIVCINQRLDDYAETLHVLKFAEVTQELQIIRALPLTRSQVQPTAVSKFKIHISPQKLDNEMFFVLSKHFPFYPENFENAYIFQELQDFLSQRIKKRKILSSYLDTKWDHMQQQLKCLEAENLQLHATVDTLQAAHKQERDRNHALTKKLLTQTASIDLINENLDKCKQQINSLELQLNAKEADLKQRTEQEAEAKQKFVNKLAVMKDRTERDLELKLNQQTAILEDEIRKKDEKLRLVSTILQADNIQTLRRSISFEYERLNETLEVNSKRRSSNISQIFRRSQSLELRNRMSQNQVELSMIQNSNSNSAKENCHDGNLTIIKEIQEKPIPLHESNIRLPRKIEKNLARHSAKHTMPKLDESE